MCRNNRNPKTSYIWCSIVRVKGVAINLLPEHANIPAIDRRLRDAMDRFIQTADLTFLAMQDTK